MRIHSPKVRLRHVRPRLLPLSVIRVLRLPKIPDVLTGRFKRAVLTRTLHVIQQTAKCRVEATKSVYDDATQIDVSRLSHCVIQYRIM